MAEQSLAVVTGGSRGIGRAISHGLAAAGHRVIRTGRSADDPAPADTEFAEYVHMPLDSRESISTAHRRISNEIGPVNVLINNAGTVHDTASVDLDDDTWNRVIHTNLTAVFQCCQEFGRSMIAGDGGTIVNIASIAAFQACPPEFHLAYDASKAGVVQLTRSLAVEWAPYNVRVNAIAPGRTNTDILQAVGRGDSARVSAWLAQVPQARFFAPEEVAGAATFLVGPTASAITGQTLVIDGGHTIT